MKKSPTHKPDESSDFSDEEAQSRFERAVDIALKTPPMHKPEKKPAKKKAKPKAK